ncbi:hypothetical protein ABZV92_01765 [Streptomyces rubiginosohelvolus]|uniref:hypothetical protein n=1 Tax=Streptomyces rubiginosohelvolus TaxID=67362 RepID=UPI0033AA1555
MRALGRPVADTAAHLIAVTGGAAAELPGIAAELTGSFHRKDDAGAPLRPGAAALPAAPERHRVRARRRVCRAGGALAAAGRCRAGEDLRP